MASDEPTLRVLSLGAGVQSTTLALLACEGGLPKLDAAIFADTGWEPEAVYNQLHRIAGELAKAGIPLYKGSRGAVSKLWSPDRLQEATASIRDDVLDPHVFATIPTQVLKPDGTVGKVKRQCTGKYKVEPVERTIAATSHVSAVHFDDETRAALRAQIDRETTGAGL